MSEKVTLYTYSLNERKTHARNLSGGANDCELSRRANSKKSGKGNRLVSGHVRNRRNVELFHWHGETFDIPESALPIARSEACKNQGFRLGRTFGLQFHLETTEATMRDILENGKGELSEALLSRGRFVQSESRILAEGNLAIPRANAALVKLLDKIIEDSHG